MRARIPWVTATLLGFILTVFLLLRQFDFVVAAPDLVLYDKAQKAQRSFLAMLETLVNIDSGTGNRKGLTKVEDLAIEQLKSVGADVKTIDATPNLMHSDL